MLNRRIVVKTAQTLAVALLLLIVVLHARNYQLRLRAEKLTAEILNPGQPLGYAANLDNQFGDGNCVLLHDTSCRYTIANLWGMKVPALSYIGIYNWILWAEVAGDGQSIRSATFELIVGGRRTHTSPFIMISNAAPSQADLCQPDRRKNRDYAIARKPCTGCSRLEVQITPSTSAELRQRAFHLNFACITSLVSCDRLSQLAPDVWNDEPHLRLSQAEASHFQTEIDADPKCQALREPQQLNR